MSHIARNNWSGQPWLLINQNDLAIEEQQCREEGVDLSSVEGEFAALRALDLDIEANQQRAESLLDRIPELPQRPGYPYHEPSNLADIADARPVAIPLPVASLNDAALLDKALGGWQGRAAGCLLGKPVEGRRSCDIKTYLTAQGRWPLDRYFSRDATPEMQELLGFKTMGTELFEEGITGMPEDDDTNYTATGLAIIKQCGSDFTPSDVARFWLGNIPIFHVCTAERIAYKNLVNCVPPPLSARYRNCYREWIGAQIRGDFFGYVNPGAPDRAAEFAWRDAAISHVKNGIYGEMWVAAMLAAAYVCDEIDIIIKAGMAQIPANCRLAAALTHVIELHASGCEYDDAIDDLRTRWDESKSHDWCHTISNAEIVAIALLWGAKDFEKTICYSVMPGFDTDCNGATSGSVLGVLLGAHQLPEKWIAPLRDTLHTGVAGYHTVSLTQMARETVELIHKNAVINA